MRLSFDRAYRVEANSNDAPAPLGIAGASSGDPLVIVLRIVGTEDIRAVAAEPRALRSAYPAHHVGLWLTDAGVALSARRTLEQTTRADFTACGADGPRFDRVRQELLDPRRLPGLAESWISARFPELSPKAQRFFALAHHRGNSGRRVPRLAAHLGVSERTMRRHLGSIGSPAEILRLGRMLQFAVSAARRPDRSLVEHAASFGMFDYRSFTRLFGRSPGIVRSIVGPADLWQAWWAKVGPGRVPKGR
jgi:hypothetical protein